MIIRILRTVAFSTFFFSGLIIPSNAAANSSGMVTTDINWNSKDTGSRLTILPDGKVLVLGSTTSTGSSARILVRYKNDGLLDTEYGNTGILNIDGFSSTNEVQEADLATQPDGKSLIAGANQDFGLIARLGIDGTLDKTFGVIGKVTVDQYKPYLMAMQSDGKILVAGTGKYHSCEGCQFYPTFAISRLLPNGDIDNQFGQLGTVEGELFQFVNQSYEGIKPSGITALGDGKILLSGTHVHSGKYFSTSQLVLKRYLADGTADSNYGNNGQVDFSNHSNTANGESYGHQLLPNGKALVVGATSSYRPSALLVQVNSDGTLDANFGTNGTTTIRFTDAAEEGAIWQDVALQSDGKIVVTGSSNISGSSSVMTVARFLPNGNLDPGFGTGGKVSTVFPGRESGGRAVAIQPDGRILVTGYAGDDIALVRYTANGSLDISFGPQTAPAYPLSVAKEGIGTVTSSPAGLDCGAICHKDFPQYSTVSLTATAPEGSTFTGWSGACSGDAPVCQLTLSDATKVTASFSPSPPPSYPLNVTTQGKGYVTIDPMGTYCGSDSVCSNSVARGSIVTLTAFPEYGALYHFAGWSGACAGQGSPAGYPPICQVTMAASKSVTATFTNASSDQTYTLDLTRIWPSATAGGTPVLPPYVSINPWPSSISCTDASNAHCLAVFPADTVVTLTAIPTDNTRFVGWDGRCAGWQDTCQLKMDKDKDAVASFAEGAGAQASKPVLVDAIYMYQMPLYGQSEKRLTGHNCDILELILDVSSGYTDVALVPSVAQGSMTNYVDRIYDTDAMFTYTLYSNASGKQFILRNNKNPSSDAQIGMGTFFGYCYSTQSNAHVDVYDKKTGITYFSDGTTR
jgi:uncharacterized delta-60 repeat protein